MTDEPDDTDNLDVLTDDGEKHDNVLPLEGDDKASARARRALAHYFDGDPEKIAAALDEYDGTYPDFRVYTRRELEEHIAPYMLWLLDRWVDLDGIANDWIANGRNWLLPDGDDAVHVFLTSRPMADIDERDIDLETGNDDRDLET